MSKRIGICIILTILFSSCTRYGGRAVHVEFRTNPPGSSVYLIPLIEWDRQGGEQMMKKPDKIKDYRIGGSQLTPFGVKVGFHEQVVVCLHGVLSGWKPVAPDEGDVISIELSSHDQ